MRVILLRHGQSGWDEPVADRERPLTPRGIQDAPRMGRWLREQGYIPDVVISSPALRAITTARLACQAGDFVAPFEAEELYGAGLADLERLARGGGETVLLVGHNPTFEMAVSAWTGAARAMPTAAVAVIDLDAQDMVAWMSPKDLP